MPIVFIVFADIFIDGRVQELICPFVSAFKVRLHLQLLLLFNQLLVLDE